MKKLYLVLLVLVALGLAGCQAISAAADGEVTLEEFLLLLTTGPGIGIVLAVALEKVPFLSRLFDQIGDMEAKRLVVLVACVVLAVGAQALRGYLGHVVFDQNAIFTALAAAWEAFTTGTILHAFIRNDK